MAATTASASTSFITSTAISGSSQLMDLTADPFVLADGGEMEIRINHGGMGIFKRKNQATRAPNPHLYMTCSLFTWILSQRTFSLFHLIQSGFMIIRFADLIQAILVE
ncbi:uncharacterized protein LOC119322669 [Triticum dicoccoides]|uniref:uncharacterized protein LOC119322669 n=1 Tax=Triticum dicoccoides TaxID=85692 RepID=UPI001891CEE0|nr:uncharacterized protein LOC119322669 [Triticum dicoccoides]XP_044412398.1 uncharacterized protein LOC123136944 [Triticum aestivum]